MENFKNVEPEFVDIYWDHGRKYSVPWQFGTTAFDVNTDKYKGDIDYAGPSSSIRRTS